MNAAKNKWEFSWCDGIYEPEINQQYTSRNITGIKQITTQAWIWIGSDRQYKLEMTITLGRCSRRKALKGTDLSRCQITLEENYFELVEREYIKFKRVEDRSS